MHEAFGLTLTVVEFGRMIVEAEFKVYAGSCRARDYSAPR